MSKMKLIPVLLLTFIFTFLTTGNTVAEAKTSPKKSDGYKVAVRYFAADRTPAAKSAKKKKKSAAKKPKQKAEAKKAKKKKKSHKM